LYIKKLQILCKAKFTRSVSYCRYTRDTNCVLENMLIESITPARQRNDRLFLPDPTGLFFSVFDRLFAYGFLLICRCSKRVNPFEAS